jgi:hypothetical protein
MTRRTSYGVAAIALGVVGSMATSAMSADASTVAKKTVAKSTFTSFPSHAKYSAKPLTSTKMKKVVYMATRDADGHGFLKVKVSLSRVFESTNADAEVVSLAIAPNRGGSTRSIFNYAGSAVVIANSENASLDPIPGGRPVRNKSADTITLMIPLEYTGLKAARAKLTTTVNNSGRHTRANGLEAVVQFSESTCATTVTNFG